MDWRSNNNNRLYDPDTNFKRIVESEKLKRVKQVSQTGAPLSLTKQQIEDRLARQEIIQQAVKDVPIMILRNLGINNQGGLKDMEIDHNEY